MGAQGSTSGPYSSKLQGLMLLVMLSCHPKFSGCPCPHPSVSLVLTTTSLDSAKVSAPLILGLGK